MAARPVAGTGWALAAKTPSFGEGGGPLLDPAVVEEVHLLGVELLDLVVRPGRCGLRQLGGGHAVVLSGGGSMPLTLL
ncbi:hypothetical protein RB200_11365 [Streptomyces sp. PmtG]